MALLLLLYITVFFSEGVVFARENTSTLKIDEEAAKLYSKKITQLEKKYGVYREENLDSDNALFPDNAGLRMEGVCYLQLIDFNTDGEKDLLAVWYDQKKDCHYFAIYSAIGGKCIKLGQDKVGADSSPALYWFGISTYLGKPCFVTSSALPRRIYGIKNNKLKLYLGELDSGKESYYDAVEQVQKKMGRRYNLNGINEKSPWRISNSGKNSPLNRIKKTKKELGLNVDTTNEIEMMILSFVALRF